MSKCEYTLLSSSDPWSYIR